MTVFATHGQGDHGDYPDHDSDQEKRGCCDHDNGHAGLQHFRPAEFVPRIRFR
jgi:hypothetical protein